MDKVRLDPFRCYLHIQRTLAPTRRLKHGAQSLYPIQGREMHAGKKNDAMRHRLVVTLAVFFIGTPLMKTLGLFTGCTSRPGDNAGSKQPICT